MSVSKHHGPSNPSRFNSSPAARSLFQGPRGASQQYNAVTDRSFVTNPVYAPERGDDFEHNDAGDGEPDGDAVEQQVALPPAPYLDTDSDEEADMWPTHSLEMGKEAWLVWLGKFKMYRYNEGSRRRPPVPQITVAELWPVVNLMFTLESKFAREAERLQAEAVAALGNVLVDGHWEYVEEGMSKYCCRVQGDTLLKFLAFRRKPNEDPLTVLAEFESQYTILQDVHPLTVMSRIDMYKTALCSAVLSNAISHCFTLVLPMHQTLAAAGAAAQCAYTQELSNSLVRIAQGKSAREPAASAAGPSRHTTPPAGPPPAFFCTHHKVNTTHSTADCHVLRKALTPKPATAFAQPLAIMPAPRAPRARAAAVAVVEAPPIQFWADQGSFNAAVAQAVRERNAAQLPPAGQPSRSAAAGAAAETRFQPAASVSGPCPACGHPKHALARCYIAHPQIAIDAHGLGYRPYHPDDAAKFEASAKKQGINIGKVEQYRADLDQTALRAAERRRSRLAGDGMAVPLHVANPPRANPPPTPRAYAAVRPPASLYSDTHGDTSYDANDSFHE